jgi:hypothetical protein
VARLTVQPHEHWQPLRKPRAIGLLDRTPDELTTALGWAWVEVEEDGIGQMLYATLAWDGKSRFLLSASGVYPGDGIAIEAEAEKILQALAPTSCGTPGYGRMPFWQSRRGMLGSP